MSTGLSRAWKVVVGCRSKGQPFKVKADWGSHLSKSHRAVTVTTTALDPQTIRFIREDAAKLRRDSCRCGNRRVVIEVYGRPKQGKKNRWVRLAAGAWPKIFTEICGEAFAARLMDEPVELR